MSNKSAFYNTASEIKKFVAAFTGDTEMRGDFGFMNSGLYMEGVRRDIDLMRKYLDSGSILDLGCGTGAITVLCSGDGYECHGVDILPEVPNIRGAKEDAADRDKRLKILEETWAGLSERFEVGFKHYDGKTFPYDDASFDGVMAYAVMEHIADELLPGVVEEIDRVLKPGGYLFVLRTPRNESYLERLFKSHDKLMKEAEVKALLKERNFQVLFKDRTDFLPQFAPAGRLQNMMNSLTPPLYALQLALDWLPTNYLSSHMRIVARKTA